MMFDRVVDLKRHEKECKWVRFGDSLFGRWTSSRYDIC
jgi:hypothetical protein